MLIFQIILYQVCLILLILENFRSRQVLGVKLGKNSAEIGFSILSLAPPDYPGSIYLRAYQCWNFPCSNPLTLFTLPKANKCLLARKMIQISQIQTSSHLEFISAKEVTIECLYCHHHIFMTLHLIIGLRKLIIDPVLMICYVFKRTYN